MALSSLKEERTAFINKLTLHPLKRDYQLNYQIFFLTHITAKHICQF